MYLSKRTITFLCFAGIILYITPMIVYLTVFRSGSLSTDPQAWGAFGGFLDGMLNPLLSMANLAVLIYLTFLAARFEDKNNQKNLDAQKKLQLSELRFKAYSELSQVLDAVNFNRGDDINIYTSRQLRGMIDFIDRFLQNQQFLFLDAKELSEWIFRTSNSLSAMNNAIVEWHRTKNEGCKDEYRKHFVEYLNNSNNIKVILQVFIMNN
jgi:hypothetical protein